MKVRKLALTGTGFKLRDTPEKSTAWYVVTWAPAPPFLPPGARFAVLQGDPGQAGIYTIRLELPAGYVIRPHFHPADEHITVGGFITATAQAHHYAVARAKTVVQVHGEGPFAITYVRAADDPRAAAPRARQ